VLEGRAIQDVWIVPNRTLRVQSKSHVRNRYGTTLRIYDPVGRSWKVYWNNPVNGSYNYLEGKVLDSEIVQLGSDANGNNIRWQFVGIMADSFHWIGEISSDDKVTWALQTEFFGKRKVLVNS